MKSNALRKSIESLRFLLLSALLMYSLGPSASGTPDPDFVDAAWVSQRTKLTRVAASDGSALLEVAGSGYRSIAVDATRARLWTFGDGVLSSLGFDGTVRASLVLGGGNTRRVDIVVDPTDGSVWIGVKTTLYHVNHQGQFLGSQPLQKNTVSVQVDDTRDLIWIATKRSVESIDYSGQSVQSLSLGSVDRVKAMALDPETGDTWVAATAAPDDDSSDDDGTNNQPPLLRSYTSTGTLRLSLELGTVTHLATISTGGGSARVWAATDNDLFLLDAASGAVLFQMNPFSAQGEIDALAAHPRDSSVWVANGKDVQRIGTNSVVLQEVSVSKNIRDLAAYADLIPPNVSFSSPANDSLINSNIPTFELDFSDAGIGVDTDTLNLLLDGDPLAVACTYTETAATCDPVALLPDGLSIVEAKIADLAGNVSAPAEVQFTVDTEAPQIIVSNPAKGSATNQAQLTITGTLSEPATLTIDGDPVMVDLDNAFSAGPFTLIEGGNDFDFQAIDEAGNSAGLVLSVILDTVPPTPPNTSLIDVEDLRNGQFEINGEAGSVESGALVTGLNLRTGETVTVVANADGSFSAQIAGNAGDTFQLQLTDAAGNTSTTIEVGFNQPPVFQPVGNLIAPVGTTLSVDLDATDPNGDPLSFAAAPLPLPGNATLNATTGAFTFRPITNDIGEYDINFSVTDGIFVVHQTVHVTVPVPDPAAATSFSGRLLDANDYSGEVITPIAGATVSFLGTGSSAVSDQDGYVTINNLPSGSQVLDIDATNATPAPDGSAYAGFREAFILEANVNNLVERPFFLPRIDADSLTSVDPTQTTQVINAALGVMLEVPPHTAKNLDGSDFTGSLSISEVPIDLAPAALPTFLDPGLLVTIQPVGVIFETPVPITFPNVDGFPVGNEVDIWSLDPESGQFMIVATGQVTADGQSIETISGGIRAADWHAAMPPQADPHDESDEPNCQCPHTNNSGSRVNTRTGWVSTDITLPTYRSLEQDRALRFVYRSESAFPQPVVPFDITVPVRAAVPPTVSYEAQIGGIQSGNETFVSTAGLSENVDETIRGVAHMDATGLETGAYPFRIDITSNYPQSRISTSIMGRTAIVNEQDSAFGAGWNLAGLQRLYQNTNGDLLITDGAGSFAQFSGISTAGGSLKFDGNDDFVQFGNITPLVEHTLEAWVRVNDPTPAGRSSVSTFLGQLNGPGIACGQGTGLRVTRDGFAYYVVDPAGCGGVNSANLFSPTPIIDTWTHLAGTFDGSTARLYINGEFVGEQEGQITPTSWLAMAAELHAIGWLSFADAEIDEVRIWNRARSQSEIQSTMLTTLSGTEPGLGGYWKLDEGQGQLVGDSGPVGVTGTLGTNNAEEPFDPAWQDFGAPIDCAGGNCIYESFNGDFSVVRLAADGTFVRTAKDSTQIHFDVNGLQTTRIDRNGNTTTYSYDTQQRLTSITDPVGQVTTLNYSGNRLNSVIDPAGRATTFVHDTAGNLTQVVFPDTSAKQFGYDSNHLMTSETNERGHATTRQFDFTGRLVSTRRPDDTTRQATNIHSFGAVDPADGSGTQSNPAPMIRLEDVMATFTDGNGHAATLEVDGYGNVTRVTDANGLTTLTDRDADGNPIRIVHPDGSEATRTFDSLGNLLTVTEGFNGATTTNTYDPVYSLLTSTTDPRGHTTTFERNSLGNVTKRTDPLGHETGMVYDARGLVTEITDPNGFVTTFVHNAAGLVQTQTETLPAGGGGARVTTYEYDTAGQLTKITDPDGVVVDMEDDQRGRLIRTTDNLGQRVEHSYDENGNLTGVDTFDSDGTRVGSISQMFDLMDRLSSVSQPQPGGIPSVTIYQYDGNGNRIEITDPNTNTILQIYDAGDRLTDSVDALSGTTHFSYDKNGNIIGVTAPNGASTSYTIDSLGRQTSESSPDRGTMSMSYDLANNLVSTTDARGITSTYTYDQTNRPTGITYPDASENVAFGYDSCAFGKGRLCTRTDESGTTAFGYDAYGNITTVTNTVLGVPYTTSYQYDAGDRVIGMTLPSERAVTVERDVLRRIEGILTEVGGSTTQLVDNITYRADGRITGRGYGNSISESRQYDEQGRLTNQNLGTLDQVTYGYDANGNVLSRQTQSVAHGFEYDALDRLIDDVLAGAGITYTYDPNGNRLSVDDGTTPVTYTYEAMSNRLSGIDPTSMIHDAAGNLIDDGQGRIYMYNDANRLEAVLDQGTLLASYVYNATGQRMQKVTTAGTTVYHYDLAGNLISETGADSTPVRDYLWQDGEPIAKIETAGGVDTLAYLHADHLATPRQATDPAGSLVWQWTGRAFGESLPDEDPDGDSSITSIPLRFPGQYYDAETGLQYNWNRYYDPKTGRYITSDPIGLEGGINTFLYVKANPLRYVDPRGLESPLGGFGAYFGPRDTVSFSIGGTLGNLDVTYNTHQGVQKTIIALPEFGGSVAVCFDLGKECDDAKKPPTFLGFDSVTVLFRNLGVTRSGDIWCVNVGIGIGIPVPGNAGGGPPIPSDEFGPSGS
jgi:RHS repeat-associated protein